MLRSVSHRVRFLAAPALCLLAVAAAVLPSSASAAPAAADRTEVMVPSASLQSGVAVSLVRLRVPLPASAAPHPEACDWVQYLRFRRADRPDDAMAADAVSVLMPGNVEGAAAFDPVARSAVREAARRGRTIEVWATDRRANCLEDLTGLQAMERSATRRTTSTTTTAAARSTASGSLAGAAIRRCSLISAWRRRSVITTPCSRASSPIRRGGSGT